jgi:hypothetical protein
VCSVLSLDYPCRNAISGVVSDPSSLLSRSLFTPAEDDLLLRGLMHVGQTPGSLNSSDNLWSTIREKFLPSKDKQLLEFRYTQLVNAVGPEGDKFKKYVKLMRERGKSQPKWTLEEDIDLLKGFQVYGDKWHMINLYFLPHRPRRELKSRWTTLLKDSSKAFPDMKGPVRPDGSINSNVTYFLADLKNRGAQAEGGADDGGAEGGDDGASDALAAFGDAQSKSAGTGAGAGLLLQFAPGAARPAAGGVRAIGTHTANIMDTLREADDDVLADTESDESANESESEGDSHLQSTSLQGSGFSDAAHNSSLATAAAPDTSYYLSNSVDNSSSRGVSDDPDSSLPGIPSDWLLETKRADFQNVGCSIPSMSQFEFPSESILGRVLSVSSARDLQSPEKIDAGAGRPAAAQVSSPRFVETSLGAFNFTVPHLADGGYSNFGSKPSKRPLDGEQYKDSSETGKFRKMVSPNRDRGDMSNGIGGDDFRGTSLFERVMPNSMKSMGSSSSSSSSSSSAVQGKKM